MTPYFYTNFYIPGNCRWKSYQSTEEEWRLYFEDVFGLDAVPSQKQLHALLQIILKKWKYINPFVLFAYWPKQVEKDIIEAINPSPLQRSRLKYYRRCSFHTDTVSLRAQCQSWVAKTKFDGRHSFRGSCWQCKVSDEIADSPCAISALPMTVLQSVLGESFQGQCRWR
jgi:hypothetical protein